RTRLLSGNEDVIYFNNSPYTLKKIVIRLYQDFYKYGAARNFEINKETVSDGINLTQLKFNDENIDLTNSSATNRGNALLIVRLSKPLLPSTSINISADWSFVIPKGSNVRMGTYDSSTFFIAYWYPQVAVYDDIDGWDVIGYNGEQEFYNDFNNFDVELTVPVSMGIWATGLLQNPESVLQPEYLKRLRQAKASDEVVNIITKEDLQKTVYINSSDKNVWKFKAEHVPDFAFGTSDHYLWDASTLKLDDKNVLISAVYIESSEDFYKVAGIARSAIEYFSTDLPGVPYPYPSMTVFNGAGGMEFPMIVNNGSASTENGTVHLTSHEICHTYFPFYMGVNEKKYAWMDEGWAVMIPFKFQATNAVGYDPYARYVKAYESISGAELEMPMITPSILLRSTAYRAASYNRPSIAYQILLETLGEEVFKTALKEYIQNWNGKHPVPFDFFNSFNKSTAQDLNWFWKPWFFEKGYPDLAIKKIDNGEGVVRVLVEKVGNIPVPVYLNIKTGEGEEITVKRSASIWKDGASEVWVEHELPAPPQQITIGSKYVPDVNNENNKLK
ncbi:MAG: M1 family metallopeptidase, partial [Ignavibacteriaceae bacterium]|nr:M1 family metallopeptidase [Ignavibacteriaceae bacterium]